MTHLVWDWNGTLFDDLALVVTATNASLASVAGPVVTTEEHRRDFHRPVSSYYAQVLGRMLAEEEFVALDTVFHVAYRSGLAGCRLAPDAHAALDAWTGSQSLLSMWFHDELVPVLTDRGLSHRFARVDGLRLAVGGGRKAEHLVAHLAALEVAGPDTVLIGDSLDDAHAAAAVGARCVLYAGGFTDRTRLDATGLPVATSLVEAVSLASALSPAAGQPPR